MQACRRDTVHAGEVGLDHAGLDLAATEQPALERGLVEFGRGRPVQPGGAGQAELLGDHALGATQAVRDGLAREPAAVLESEDVLDHAYVHSWLGHWLSGKSREARAPSVVHTQRQRRPVDRLETAFKRPSKLRRSHHRNARSRSRIRRSRWTEIRIGGGCRECRRAEQGAQGGKRDDPDRAMARLYAGCFHDGLPQRFNAVGLSILKFMPLAGPTLGTGV